ncbi:MAG: hypothetical protein ACO1SX_23710 [Actinomycetota bacterium]
MKSNPTLSPVNDPEAFSQRSPAAQAVLLEWIRLACHPVRTADRDSSYGMKHDFEADAFYVTNGEFKGAMRAAGYAPVAPEAGYPEFNWRFCVRPMSRKRRTRSEAGGTGRYGIEHLSADERARFDRLMARWKAEQPVKEPRSMSTSERKTPTPMDQARALVRNLREALAYPLALERAAVAASEEERAAVRRLLLRAYEERGPRLG